MKIETISQEIEEAKGDAFLCGLFENEKKLDDLLKRIDKVSSSAVNNFLSKGDFKGKLNETAVLYPLDGVKLDRIILAGLGEKGKFNLDKLRQVSATASRKAKSLKCRNLVTALHSFNVKGANDQDKAQAIVEGMILGTYEMTEYKTIDKEDWRGFESLTFVEKDKRKLKSLKKGIGFGQDFAWANNLVRDMANHPANVMTPAKMAGIALDSAKEYGFKCKVLSLSEIEKLKMNAFLGVGKGSSNEPKFLIMEYVGRKAPKIVLVGKGITFDSGGYSLKPTEGMANMKTDMSGAASVIAIMAVASKLKFPLNLVGLVPLTENLISGNAQKVGDIVKSYSGKTIEIINTDAEGRLILADALSYAGEYKPDAIVDIATLTGAARIALGETCCAILGNDDKLKNRVRRASQRSGEKVWELPLWDEYREQLKSDLADIKNSGGRSAGTITAGMFLKEFVGNHPWIHIDIAAVDFEEKGKPYIPKGGTGYGTRLILEFLRDLAGVK
jgi:leucyl aminopeptidase